MALTLTSPDGGNDLARLRPIELVELAELSYQRMFANGLWLMLVGSLASVMMIIYRGLGSSDLGPLAGLGLMLAATLLAMRSPAQAFHAIRRNQLWVPALGLGLAIILASIGTDSAALFFSCATALGIIRTACSSSLMWFTVLLVATGQMWPLLIGQADGGEAQNLAATAGGLVVVAVGAGLLFDYLARFMLGLQRTIDLAAAPAAPRRFPNHEHFAGGAASEDSSAENDADRPQLPTATTSHRTIQAIGERSGTERLTVRQLEVIALACEGLRIGEIAACLDISPRQVRRLIDGARRRTATATTAELVAWALRNEIFGALTRSRPSSLLA